jgi:hypothetical protein
LAATVTAETAVLDAVVAVTADVLVDELFWTDAAFAVAYKVPRSTVVAAAQATIVVLRLPCSLR